MITLIAKSFVGFDWKYFNQNPHFTMSQKWTRGLENNIEEQKYNVLYSSWEHTHGMSVAHKVIPFTSAIIGFISVCPKAITINSVIPSRPVSNFCYVAQFASANQAATVGK